MAPTMATDMAEPDIQREPWTLDSPVESAVVPTNDEIAKLAYSLWEARGGVGGSAEEDWLTAEAALRQ
ncbi:MAG: hypothetical protein JWO19_4930 [Bryobacterales bacterium]|nr:hypothetical protein [Bryobacterales bacterium]